MAHFLLKTLSVLSRGVAPIAVQLRSNRLCQRVFDRRGAVQVELASEEKNRCLAPIPLEGQRKIALDGGLGLRPWVHEGPR